MKTLSFFQILYSYCFFQLFISLIQLFTYFCTTEVRMTHKELIQKFKEGDEKAFSSIYKLYWEKVYNFSHLYLVSSEDVAEIVQEIFIKLWETRHLVDEEQSFEGFLFIVTRNQIFNYSRKQLNYSFLKMTVLESIEKSYEEEDKLEISDLKQYLSVLISQLPKRQQEIFRLSREQHMTYKQIAEELSISEKTVEYHMTAALKYLRKNLYLLSLFLN